LTQKQHHPQHCLRQAAYDRKGKRVRECQSDALGDEKQGEPYEPRHNDNVVQIAQYRYEVRDEVDRADKVYAWWETNRLTSQAELPREQSSHDR
jgi:hypothetical protein